jgi:tetratricopeptide (TPR) repeat protein
VTLLVLLFLVLPPQPEPPLSALALDAFPPAARDAIARAQRDAAAHPADPERVGTLARTLHAWELWEAAHQTYERLRRIDPRRRDWPYLHGVVLQRLARHEDAAAAFRAALTIDPSYLPARVKLAEALLEAGHLDESATLFTGLVNEPAAEPMAEMGLGRVAAAQGQHDAAVAHLEKAVALFPELGAAHYALARSYRALGRRDDARRALALHERYGARWPAIDDEVFARVAELRSDPRAEMQRGMRLAERGDIEGAIAAHEAALARDPSLAQAHSNLISLYGRTARWDRAEEHYRRVVALGVNLGDAHYDYGVLLGLQEKWEPAAAAYRRALAVNPAHAQAHNNLGQLLERQRAFDDAAREYQLAVEREPGFRLGRFNLGRMLIALNRPGDAVAQLQKLTEPRDAEAPRYLFALSVANVRAGNKDEGVRWATEAKRLALEFGQHELAAAIDRDLATLR